MHEDEVRNKEPVVQVLDCTLDDHAQKGGYGHKRVLQACFGQLVKHAVQLHRRLVQNLKAVSTHIEESRTVALERRGFENCRRPSIGKAGRRSQQIASDIARVVAGVRAPLSGVSLPFGHSTFTLGLA